MGFVGNFLGWDCDEAIPLLLEQESGTGWMDEEVLALEVLASFVAL